MGIALALATPHTPAQVTPDTPDIPAHFTFPQALFDYTVREKMVPMRDGTRLYTVIVIPKGTRDAPVVLTRTPYNAHSIVLGQRERRMSDTLPLADDQFVKAGFIRVYQDVRGKHRSEGDYFMAPPLRGTINNAKVDDSTDAWDTIDWLVKHVPESNGRVGMVGYSYAGFTVALALIHPHPALKVAAPENPQIDGWMGDDWFHYGAFRNVNLGYFTEQTVTRGLGPDIPMPGYDRYNALLKAGSSGAFAKSVGLEQLPFWQKIISHPAYDTFWSKQAVDRILSKQPLKVPTLWVQGLWDHVDLWGAAHAYAATEPKDKSNTLNYLVMGPWDHGQHNFTGTSLGVFQWAGDTSLQFRRDMLLPFFKAHLVDGADKATLSPVTVYNAGSNRWEQFDHWPLACEKGCKHKSQSLYLRADRRLSFTPPPAGESVSDRYLSDPSRPVPNRHRPFGAKRPEALQSWAVADQRFVDDRPDVISYVSAPLENALRISGAPVVHLHASTSGRDSDWVVKIIDVYPDTFPRNPPMGGYEFPLAMDIFRGRYRQSFANAAPIEPNKPFEYTFPLPNINYTIQPGHRIMVQIQSSWFPRYDRNPQTWVDNIFFAKPGDYKSAWQTIWHSRAHASSISMPMAPVHQP